MEDIIQNPGLQHIVTNTLMFLDKRSIAAFQSVNQECKRIAYCPRFFIRKLGQETSQKDVIDNWKAVIQKIPEALLVETTYLEKLGDPHKTASM